MKTSIGSKAKAEIGKRRARSSSDLSYPHPKRGHRPDVYNLPAKRKVRLPNFYELVQRHGYSKAVGEQILKSLNEAVS